MNLQKAVSRKSAKSAKKGKIENSLKIRYPNYYGLCFFCALRLEAPTFGCGFVLKTPIVGARKRFTGSGLSGLAG